MFKEVNLKLAFKKVNPETGFIGKTISKLTKSKYYHIEIIIDNLWVSADTPLGVTISRLEPLRHDHWDYVDLGIKKLPQEQYDTIMEFIYKQEGKKYDYFGIIFSHLFPFTLHNKNKLFCSEIVALILQFFLEARVLGFQANTLSSKDLARLYGLKD